MGHLLRRWLGVLAGSFMPVPRSVELAPPPAPAPVSAPIAPVAVRRQPPPIPEAARRRLTPTRRKMTEQELAWQELMSGRHPRSLTRFHARPAPPESTARSI